MRASGRRGSCGSLSTRSVGTTTGLQSSPGSASGRGRGQRWLEMHHAIGPAPSSAESRIEIRVPHRRQSPFGELATRVESPASQLRRRRNKLEMFQSVVDDKMSRFTKQPPARRGEVPFGQGGHLHHRQRRLLHPRGRHRARERLRRATAAAACRRRPRAHDASQPGHPLWLYTHLQVVPRADETSVGVFA